MKPNVKILSYFLVLLNSFVLFSELPFKVIALTWLIIILSLVVKHKLQRTIVKIIFLAGALVLLKFHFKTFLVTEAGISFVLTLSALKLWELESESDFFNMFLVLALSEACLFLLSPSFLIFAIGFVKIVLFFYFILKIRNYDLSLINGKRLFILVAPSLVLSLLLFYTFPRFTSGFINATNPQMLFSGVDSQLNFKTLGPLSLSSKIVFKVYGLNLEDKAVTQLYWRENILWDFQNNIWKTGYINLKSDQVPSSRPLASYQIQLEKDYNEFLPVLDGVSRIVKSNLDYNFYSEGSFRLKNISRSSVFYEIDTSYLKTWSNFSPLMERKGLRLKSNRREEIADKIPKLKELSSDEDKLNAIKNFFYSKNFEYTLNPPAYNSIEDFILYGKRGYCSHFAAAFAFLSRVVGLPSRIVSGYQGGEYNPFDKSIIVREQDAHAWVEVFIKGRGWTKFDPTAMVAPGRIQLGSRVFHDNLEPFFDLYYYKLPKSYLQFKAIDQLSLWVDSLNSVASTSINNFDREKQNQLLNSILPTRISAGFFFTFVLSMSLPLMWIIFRLIGRSALSPHEIRYQKFVKRMMNHGLSKLPGETASSFATRCIHALPEKTSYIESETNAYINFFYKHD